MGHEILKSVHSKRVTHRTEADSTRYRHREGCWELGSLTLLKQHTSPYRPHAQMQWLDWVLPHSSPRLSSFRARRRCKTSQPIPHREASPCPQARCLTNLPKLCLSHTARWPGLPECGHPARFLTQLERGQRRPEAETRQGTTQKPQPSSFSKR